MKITGTGKSAIDADLLARLAVARGSGASITKTELNSAIRATKSDMRSDFSSSASGLDRAAKAVANTLELAVKSGWVKSGATADAIDAFIKGADKDGLKALVKDIRADVRTYTPPRRVGT
jgi:hypothetical protein